MGPICYERRIIYAGYMRYQFFMNKAYEMVWVAPSPQN